jgi:hypothetical protein
VTKAGAEKAVIISALVTAGVYTYRRLSEDTTSVSKGVSALFNVGAPAAFGEFVTAWGFSFFVIALIASAAPTLGGSFAILVLVGDLLANGQAVSSDVSQKVTGTTTTINSGNTASQSNVNAAARAGTTAPHMTTVNP